MELQSGETLEQLQARHRQAAQRVSELDAHIWLSNDEQRELSGLKRLKLHLKDRMRKLERGSS